MSRSVINSESSQPSSQPQRASRATPLSVSELNRQVKQLLEISFLRVWVTGEISNFARPSSGHWYFTLKDDRAQVRCAMFRNANGRVKPAPKEGDQVTISARVSLYEGRGEYQLIAEQMESAGIGALQRRFDELKKRLEAEGLFDADRKLPIPEKPGHIGVITSPTGAAIHDILTVLKRRCPAIPVTLYPVLVQGEDAALQIAKAIFAANRQKRCDVLIVGRGGGSLEDLWAFNEELVAQAIADSEIPIVSAVGHEIDFTIADFVADERAPTPSAAAERLSPDSREWLERIQSVYERMQMAMARQLMQAGNAISQTGQRLKHPGQKLQEYMLRLDELELRSQQSMMRRLSEEHQLLWRVQEQLLRHSPESKIRDINNGLESLRNRLSQSQAKLLSELRHRLGSASAELNVLSPLATLGRGYAIARNTEQKVIRTIDDVETGEEITTQLGKGTLTSKVTGKKAD